MHYDVKGCLKSAEYPAQVYVDFSFHPLYAWEKFRSIIQLTIALIEKTTRCDDMKDLVEYTARESFTRA